MAVRGKADHASMDDTALRDPAIAALRQRSRHRGRRDSAVAPRLRPARVSVTLKTDGPSRTTAGVIAVTSISRSRNPSCAENSPDLAGLVLTGEGVSRVQTRSSTASAGRACAS
jgi:hypothetical protein